MEDLIVIGVLIAVIGAAVRHVYKAKKRGVKCIGCPDGCSCSGQCGGCSSSEQI